jgi:hypothetical protein
MKKIAVHTCRLILIVGCAASCLMYATGLPLAYAQSPFNLSISGNFMPQAGIEHSDARYAYYQMDAKASLGPLNLGYTFTMFDWEQADLLALGNGQKAPWEQLHQLTLGTAYMRELNERWAYLMVAQGKAGFEKNIEKSFQEWMAIGGGQYTLSERWKLLFGGGVRYNDFETVFLPAGGFQWDAGHGISLSMIFPKESKIQYQSANQKFSAYIDFCPESSAEIAYAFSPSWKTAVRYVLSENDTYRLADDSMVNLKHGRKYLETDAQALNLDLTYTPFKHLTCDVGGSYRFEPKLSILDDDEKTLKKLKGDDSVGGSVVLTYNF